MQQPTSFTDLPRDIQIAICKHFNMDTRIKCGIVHRLKVPKAISSQLDKVLYLSKTWKRR